jgi:hypothetical protein
MKSKEEFQELSTAFASMVEKFKTAKADDMGEKEGPEMDDVMEMCSNLSRRIDYVANSNWDYQYSHAKNHVPQIKTASQMEAFLKACKMDGDFVVEKPSIYVNASANTVEVAYKK